MKLSKIEWTDATWNPSVGCDKVSAGVKRNKKSNGRLLLGQEWNENLF